MQKSVSINSISLSLRDLEEKVFFMLVTLIVFSVVLHFYFISATIVSVVDRTVALGEVKALDTKISELESERMAVGSMIDLSEAKTSGYEEVTKINYISRTVSLSFAK